MAGPLWAHPRIAAAAHPGDTLTVSELFRLCRDLSDIQAVRDWCQARGTILRVLAGPLSNFRDLAANDATTDLIVNVLIAVGQFQRDIQNELTGEGIAAAAAEGRYRGRPPALAGAPAEQARAAYLEQGASIAALARAHKVSRAAVRTALAGLLPGGSAAPGPDDQGSPGGDGLTDPPLHGRDANRCFCAGWFAAGVFLGGVLSQGPGWRWVLFVNLPVCALILLGAYRLVPAGRPAARPAGFDIPGAVLATGGMLLLVYALVRAPDQGWGSARTIGELATAAVLLAAFTVTELRRHTPLFPFSIFRVRGLAASDAVQMIAFAAFVSVFYFLTLYMQNILVYSPIRSGSAYLPVTAGIVVAAGISSKLFARIGTRPVIVAGALIAAAGVWYLSRIPVHGTYPASLLPGLVLMAVGIGAVLVAVTTAANAGVPADKAGLAAGLLSASQQLGTALGLAIFSPSPPRAPARCSPRTPGGMPRSPLASTAPCWPARSSCSPPRSSRCAPPTAAASPSPSPAAPPPPATRYPRRNWPTDPRPREARRAASQPAH